MTDEPTPEQSGINNLYCFMDSERVCGADCMAFITFPRASNSSELSEFQTHCSLLSAADRLGRNVTIVAAELVARNKRDKINRIDDDRKDKAAQPVSTGPFAAQPNTSPFPQRNS